MTTDAARPGTAPFTEAELDYLRTHRLGRLATVKPNGQVQINPVSVYFNATTATIDIGGFQMAASRKFRNVVANPKVSVVIDDMPPTGVRCLEVRGVARALHNPVDSAARLEGPIIRIHPRRIISFGVDPIDPMSGLRIVTELTPDDKDSQ
ncbi:PPOX class F420-dependent oxidoreductase [Nocardia amamiensis]|uniref:PPOX class F420-dependent oxidoreductase n=1 Tax=Nocardia amamiensis TaxID=404578 RepID=UPI00083733F0|nr:PPOX class F420-dependent oxidoreductase [Nocardia amamiensis]